MMKAANIGKLSEKETFLLMICQTAGDLCTHADVIHHQQGMSESELFADMWRNLFGNPTEQAANALTHSWERWEKSVIASPSNFRND